MSISLTSIIHSFKIFQEIAMYQIMDEITVSLYQSIACSMGRSLSIKGHNVNILWFLGRSTSISQFAFS
jgi:hypothetical protein